MYDIAIAGSGIAGCASGLALCQAGFHVVLLDDAPVLEPTGALLPRVSSINLKSENLLQDLGAWSGVQDSGRAACFERIEAWDDGMHERLIFDAGDSGFSHLGHIVENELIRFHLYQQFTREDCSQHINSRLKSFSTHGGGVNIVTQAGDAISARLLIGADGAGSMVRRSSDIAVDRFDYRQSALVCQVWPARHHGFTARQKFLSSGPLAFLPLSDGSCSIVWSLDNNEVGAILELEEDDFRERLGQTFEHELGEITRIGKRYTFPLVRRHARDYVRGPAVLIGDACHTVHPLAGLGANQGLADVECLVRVIRSAKPKREFSRANLGRYQRERRAENARILAAMDLFYFGFANDQGILKLLRQSGFNLVERTTPLKNRFISHATGMV